MICFKSIHFIYSWLNWKSEEHQWWKCWILSIYCKILNGDMWGWESAQGCISLWIHLTAHFRVKCDLFFPLFSECAAVLSFIKDAGADRVISFARPHVNKLWVWNCLKWFTAYPPHPSTHPQPPPLQFRDALVKGW